MTKASAFSRKIMRFVPTFMRQYGLEELISQSKLRNNIHKEFRKHAEVKSPGAIDSLIQKGEIELEEIVKNFKQRHHVLGKYVIEPQYAARDAALPKPNHSAFLSSFYKGA